MYSVLMAVQRSSTPFSSAVLIWQRKYCEKYEGAAVMIESVRKVPVVP